MNQRDAIGWLLGEVDGLVREGVLSAEGGAALRRHYRGRLEADGSAGAPSGSASSLRTILFSVLGAVLIGAGVLLLIAHNWEELGRPARVALSLLPVAIGLALSLFTVARRGESRAWREGAGLAWAAGVGASIALVSQTYHVGGELHDFLRVWMLLILPVPYLLRAATPAMGYVIGITVWTGDVVVESAGVSPSFYALFLAGILPFFGWEMWRRRLALSTTWLATLLAVSLVIGSTYMLDAWIDFFHIWALLAGTWLSLFYLGAALAFPEKRRHPVRFLSAVGMVVVVLILSFKGVWIWSPRPLFDNTQVAALFGVISGSVVAALAALAGGLWGWRRGRDFGKIAAAFGLAVLLAWSAAFWCGEPLLAAIGMNLYGLALALGSLFRGLRDRTLVTLNGGLLLLSGLIVARFLDSSLGIMERGVAFILLGALFFATNLWTLKHPKTPRP